MAGPCRLHHREIRHGGPQLGVTFPLGVRSRQHRAGIDFSQGHLIFSPGLPHGAGFLLGGGTAPGKARRRQALFLHQGKQVAWLSTVPPDEGIKDIKGNRTVRCGCL